MKTSELYAGSLWWSGELKPENIALNNYDMLTGTIISTLTASFMFGGDAVSYNGVYVFNGMLDISAPSVSTACKFWNCHTAIKGGNVFRLNLENSIFRSSQTTASLTGHQGERGLILPTSRFRYYIRNNEFTNINTCINIPISSGSYSTVSQGTQAGIYADRIIILQKTLTAGTSTNNYVNYGVNITCPNQVTPAIANDYGVSPFTKAIVVEQNRITDVYRGVRISGITGFQTSILANTLTLKTDPNNANQRAIELSNTMGALNKPRQHIVANNVVVGTGTTNATESLVYSSMNTGVQTPSVTCNELSNSFSGFWFNSFNNMSVWNGNSMQPHIRGLVIDGGANGAIGTQGNAGTSSNNTWASSWAGTYSGTAVMGNSDAKNSLLWVASGAAPPSNGGTAAPQNQYPAPGTLSLSSGGDYQCGGVPNNRSFPLPNETEDGVESYIANTSAFRTLIFNDSILTSDSRYSQFTQSLEESTIEKLMLVEQKISAGDFSGASGVLADIEATEDNYWELENIMFYSLFLNYRRLEEGERLSFSDSVALSELCHLCPAANGAFVYQTRALFNAVYQTAIPYDDCVEDENLRKRPKTADSSLNISESQISIFPNPANNSLSIISSAESEWLDVIISDVSGTLIYSSKHKTQTFMTNFTFDLANGLYLVTITNSLHEKFTKKVVIAK